MNFRRLTIAIALAAALIVVPAADAAKLKIGGGKVAVNDYGVAAIKVRNPNRSAAKGKLTLKSSGVTIGSRSFKVRSRRRATVRVRVTHPDARQILANGDGLKATAFAKAKGRGTARKNLVLYYPGASNGGGGQQQAGPAWSEGRWQGTWQTNSTDLAFNITGTRLYTGPFDAFYITANCDDGSTDSTAMEPIEATIAGNGDFSGSGTYVPSPEMPMPWTLAGHVSGKSLTGTLSVSYDNGYHGHCRGTANFTAAWYSDYTL